MRFSRTLLRNLPSESVRGIETNVRTDLRPATAASDASSSVASSMTSCRGQQSKQNALGVHEMGNCVPAIHQSCRS
jgi:hypothetical protein